MEKLENSKKSIVWLWVLTLFLTFILASSFEYVYLGKFISSGSAFLKLSHSSYLGGLIFAYFSIFSALCLALLKHPLKILSWGLGVPFVFLVLALGAWKEATIEISLIIFGLLTGWLIRMIVQKIKSDESNKELRNSIKSIGWFWFLVLLLTLLFTPFWGDWYNANFGPVSNWFWGPSHPEYFEGMFLSYYLAISFLCFALLKKPWKIFIWGVGIPLFIFSVLIGAWLELELEIVFVILGLSTSFLVKEILRKLEAR